MEGQAQLWGHFKDQLLKTLQYQDPISSAINVISKYMGNILLNIAEETPVRHRTEELSAQVDTLQLELQTICDSLKPNKCQALDKIYN